MIDIENEVFSRARKAVLAVRPKAFVTGEYVRAPEHFPCVSIEEKDNSVLRTSVDSGSSENHAAVMYEVNVFSNKAGVKKSECKDLLDAVDAEMAHMGFIRTMKAPIPNLEDATVFRLTARYEAVVSYDHTIYRR